MASKGAKPKKKLYLDVGAPGKGSPAVASGMWPEKQKGALPSARNPLQGGAAGAASSPNKPLEQNPTGRPKSNLGQYLIKPSPTALSGWEMLNETPDLLDQVHQKYLKAFELPPHLQSTRFQAPTLEKGRANNISRGWRKPRSRAG
jgi:hypothetical protein